MLPAFIVAIGILGTIVGSFLNVVVYRVPRGKSLLFPPSQCPSCAVPIRARHNVPLLGWLVLRGRCAVCRAPISVRYPAVELGTGVLFVLVARGVGTPSELPAFLFLASAALVFALTEADGYPAGPGAVVACGIVATMLLLPTRAVDGLWPVAGRGLLGAAMVAFACLVAALVAHRPVPPAVLWLAAVVGFFLAWLAWTPALLVTAAVVTAGPLCAPARRPATSGRTGTIPVLTTALSPSVVLLAAAALALAVS